jgi:hypothetical protein
VSCRTCRTRPPWSLPGTSAGRTSEKRTWISALFQSSQPLVSILDCGIQCVLAMLFARSNGPTCVDRAGKQLPLYLMLNTYKRTVKTGVIPQ